MLCIYIDYNQKNWDSLLPLAEFAINNMVSSSTGSSPFFLNSGIHPLVTSFSTQTSDTPTTLTSAQTLQANLTLAKDLLHRAQDCQSFYANLRHQDIAFSSDDL